MFSHVYEIPAVNLYNGILLHVNPQYLRINVYFNKNWGSSKTHPNTLLQRFIPRRTNRDSLINV